LYRRRRRSSNPSEILYLIFAFTKSTLVRETVFTSFNIQLRAYIAQHFCIHIIAAYKIVLLSLSKNIFLSSHTLSEQSKTIEIV